jgi:site-specific DNA-adenine methylase
MDKYTCNRCGKEFSQKFHYVLHVNTKNPCIVKNVETLKDSEFIFKDDKFVKDTNCKKITVPKPILKWVGGKTQILHKLIVEFPTNIHNYHEIFLGGGSVLLTVLSYIKHGIIKVHGNIHAYDLNEPLIFLYKNIQSNHNELYNQIQKLIIEFNSCGDREINRSPKKNINEAKVSKENYYYWIRNEYNQLSTDDKKTTMGSAMFIFLNKTCFRGVFQNRSERVQCPLRTL